MNHTALHGKPRRGRWYLGLLIVALISSRPVRAQEIVITEVLADSLGSFLDEDGHATDWIELYHAGTKAVDLGGWHLTDDPRRPGKWTFPSLVFEPGSFLVVHASAKDRRDPDSELHTNFRLSESGEFLALYDPSLELISGYQPFYPPQTAGYSFGFSTPVDSRTVVPAGSALRYLVPNSRELATSWTEVKFDDGSWSEGFNGVGFDRTEPAVFEECIATDVEDAMYSRNASIYIRVPFEIQDATLPSLVRLRAKYNDGFVAYINGQEVGHGNARDEVRFNSRSAGDRSVGESIEFTPLLIDVSGLLRQGTNVLALHGMSRERLDDNFLLVVELDFIAVTAADTSARQHFVPSPGTPNLSGRAAVAPPPDFSDPGGLFSDSYLLEISSPASDVEIRYTLNDTVPNRFSPLYEGPLTIDRSSVVRARSFGDNHLPSWTSTFRSTRLGADLANFTSDLPVLVFHTAGRFLSALQFSDAQLDVLEPDPDGRTRMTSSPTFQGLAAVKARGSSSVGRQKKSFALEIRDQLGRDRNVPLLGMEADSDWILFGPFDVDHSLIRNPLNYEISRRMGQYAVKTRFCEVFLAVGPGSDVTRAESYHGLYVFMEKITRGPHRVDVAPVDVSDNVAPEVTGGYLLKIDRLDPGDIGFEGGGLRLLYVDPKESDITDAQADWLKSHFDAFDVALDGPDFEDPHLGYTPFIDVESWIDFHIVNEFAMNPDGHVVSTYLHKLRNGPIRMGPVWDFDRTMGAENDGRSNNPERWTTVRMSNWWGRLLDDPALEHRYRQRWFEHREGVLSDDGLMGLVDTLANEVREAQVRNFQRWPVTTSAAWVQEIAELKTWLRTRLQWIDSRFQAPLFSIFGGTFDGAAFVRILNDDILRDDILNENPAEAYYTLDGEDPRFDDGEISPSARRYEGVIRLFASALLQARFRHADGTWSVLEREEYDIVGPISGPQRPGDSNQDGRLNLSDALDLVRRVFLGSNPVFPCGNGQIAEYGNRQLLDANGDSGVDGSDVTHLLLYLFTDGRPHTLGTLCQPMTGCPPACRP